MKVTQSCPTLYCLWNSPGQNTGVGSLSLLQGISPTQGSNPGLLHCRWILFQLSQQGSPRILEWVAYPFSSGSSQPRNQTGVFCIERMFTSLDSLSIPQLPCLPHFPESTIASCSLSAGFNQQILDSSCAGTGMGGILTGSFHQTLTKCLKDRSWPRYSFKACRGIGLYLTHSTTL